MNDCHVGKYTLFPQLAQVVTDDDKYASAISMMHSLSRDSRGWLAAGIQTDRGKAAVAFRT